MPLLFRVYKQPQVTGRVFYPASDQRAPESLPPRHLSQLAETVQKEVSPAVQENAVISPDLSANEPSFVEPTEQAKEQWVRLGYEQGKEKAEAECLSLKQEMQSKLKEAELCLREARRHSREIIAASEIKVVELAVAAAERLLKTQLELVPDKIIQIVRETMLLLNGGEQLAVFVSPADLTVCLGMQEQLKAEFTEVNRLEILPDGDLTRGSCRIESASGTAEYLLQDESYRLKEMLLDVARQEETNKLAEERPSYGKH